MKKVTVVLLLSWFTLQLGAQDLHFTQFYASPLNLNPALTGNYEGKYRAGINYRNQWSSVMPEPFSTVSAAFDMRFGLKFAPNDKIGGGIVFLNDRAGLAEYNTTQIAISAGYHKALNMYGSQYLSIGLQAGLGQRSINYENLTFNDQFDGFSGYTGGTGESLPGNNVAYPDISAGLMWSATTDDKKSYNLGLSFHHVNQPNISFFSSAGAGYPSFALPMKIGIQGGARIPIGDSRDSKFAISPRAAAFIQGPHLELNLGSNFRFGLDEYDELALLAGIWVRPVGDVASGVNVDAASLLAGVEWQGLFGAISYDLNLSDLSTATNGRGAFELSIMYIGSYDVEKLVCPTF